MGTLLFFEFLLHDGLIMVLLILNIGNLGEPYRIGNVKQVYNVVSCPSNDESKKSDRSSTKYFIYDISRGPTAESTAGLQQN